MTSRQKAGILFVLAGSYLLVLNIFPNITQYLRSISWPLILIILGAYLVFFKK
jgi:hypothetical protein